MTSRRTLIGSAVGCFFSNPVLAELTKDKPFVEGTDYTKVVPLIEYPKRPLLIHDFFAYTCPHCLRFAPLMKEFEESVKHSSTVKVIPVPVAWDKESEIFPRIYFGFEAIGRLEELHMAYWQWVINEDHPWETIAEAKKDTDKWIAAKGINLKKWHALIESFAISSKVKKATETWKHYGIDSTPMVGIAGQFLTAPHMTGSRPRTIKLIRELIARVEKS